MRDALATWHIGRVIFAYRTHPQHGSPWSQQTVGNWLGLTQAQLSRIENGRAPEELTKLVRWAQILGVPQNCCGSSCRTSRAPKRADGAEFAGWLYRDLQDHASAAYWYDRAMEWAQAANNTAMQGYALPPCLDGIVGLGQRLGRSSACPRAPARSRSAAFLAAAACAAYCWTWRRWATASARATSRPLSIVGPAAPAAAKLGQRQVGRELPAAVPNRPARRRVAGQGDRVPGDFAGISGAAPQADLDPGPLEPCEELPLIGAFSRRDRTHRSNPVAGNLTRNPAQATEASSAPLPSPGTFAASTANSTGSTLPLTAKPRRRTRHGTRNRRRDGSRCARPANRLG